MKKKFSIPCLPGWLAAVLFGLFALLLPFPVLQLMALAIGMAIVGYCMLRLLRRRHLRAARIGWWLLTITVAGGVAVFLVTGGLIVYAGRGSAEANCDYIVVLGAQVNQDGPSLSLQERIDTAYEYLSKHPETLAVLSGGKGDNEHISEALSMYQSLTARGIDPHRLIMEDRSTSTWENLSFSLDLIRERTGSRPGTIGVVSSEYHLYRAGLQAGEHGLTIVGIPAKTKGFGRYLYYFTREIAGVWYYIILGGAS